MCFYFILFYFFFKQGWFSTNHYYLTNDTVKEDIIQGLNNPNMEASRRANIAKHNSYSCYKLIKNDPLFDDILADDPGIQE